MTRRPRGLTVVGARLAEKRLDLERSRVLWTMTQVWVGRTVRPAGCLWLPKRPGVFPCACQTAEVLPRRCVKRWQAQMRSPEMAPALERPAADQQPPWMRPQREADWPAQFRSEPASRVQLPP